MPKRFFLDTEFIELQWQLHPVSIGIVSEDGDEYHAVVEDFPEHLADDWVKQNVIAKLPPKETWKPRARIGEELRSFVNAFGPWNPFHRPEFWGYFSSYDWVLFCWLLGGRMIELPMHWPQYCLDLKQVMHEMNIGKDALPKKPDNAHDALVDARWTKQVWEAIFVGKQ